MLHVFETWWIPEHLSLHTRRCPLWHRSMRDVVHCPKLVEDFLCQKRIEQRQIASFKINTPHNFNLFRYTSSSIKRTSLHFIGYFVACHTFKSRRISPQLQFGWNTELAVVHTRRRLTDTLKHKLTWKATEFTSLAGDVARDNILSCTHCALQAFVEQTWFTDALETTEVSHAPQPTTNHWTAPCIACSRTPDVTTHRFRPTIRLNVFLGSDGLGAQHA